MKYNIQDPGHASNDRFVLSKGHAAPSSFTVLCQYVFSFIPGYMFLLSEINNFSSLSLRTFACSLRFILRIFDVSSPIHAKDFDNFFTADELKGIFVANLDVFRCSGPLNLEIQSIVLLTVNLIISNNVHISSRSRTLSTVV